jgi:glycosyltransferase 2 family protein
VKFLIKLGLALAVGAVFVALVMRGIDLGATVRALSAVSWSVVATYVVVLAISHVFRSWRWAYLLRPIGVRLNLLPLFAVSSVGFMAIQALPVRLGEFVRPYFVVRTGQSRMSAVLGTVAVERIVDGLLISIIFFITYLVSDRGTWSPELIVGAWISLVGFVVALLFLAAALRFPERAVNTALALTLLPRFAPALAHKIHDKLGALIQGFRALAEPRDLAVFLLQSVLYWGANGFGMWVLAQGMDLPISLVAAYAAMSFTGVLISLPNAPGLVGQFHFGVVAALAAYLPGDVATRSVALAYATLLHGIQFIWYTVVGFAALPFVSGGKKSLRDAVVESNRAVLEDDAEASARLAGDGAKVARGEAG